MIVEKENTIGDLVTKNFQSARVFEEFGLDYCCGGKKSINQACKDKGIDENLVIEKLSRLEEDNSSSSHYGDWDAGFLADYIVNNHHRYIRKNIPSIENHLQKVISAHGERNPEVVKVGEQFKIMKDDLLMHMSKEEKMLFPYIHKLYLAKNNSQVISVPPFGKVQNPIKVMEEEHQQAGDDMAKISKLTNNYTPPNNSCGTFRVLYSELKDFEKDLHVHVHLENNILFPKAMELEYSVMKIDQDSCSM